jgi:hypothetical protein
LDVDFVGLHAQMKQSGFYQDKKIPKLRIFGKNSDDFPSVHMVPKYGFLASGLRPSAQIASFGRDIVHIRTFR